MTKGFIGFDVLDAGYWLPCEEAKGIIAALGLTHVPEIPGVDSINAATIMVQEGFKSWVSGATCQAEGLVGRTEYPLFDRYGERLIIKLKTKDF